MLPWWPRCPAQPGCSRSRSPWRFERHGWRSPCRVNASCSTADAKHLWHYTSASRTPEERALAARGRWAWRDGRSWRLPARPGSSWPAMRRLAIVLAARPQARLSGTRCCPFYSCASSCWPASGVAEVIRRWPRCRPADRSGRGPSVGIAACSLGLAPLVSLGVPRAPARRGVPGEPGAVALGSTCSYRNDVRPKWSGTTRARRARPGRATRPEGAGRSGRVARASAMFATMGGLARTSDHGWAAPWEYGDRSTRPTARRMAPMLLPYPHGRVHGSMEGLIESSATTPYHFTQCELSDSGLVRAAGPPYHVRVHRVSSSPSCSACGTAQAFTVDGRPGRRQRRFTLVASSSGPWHVYELLDRAAGIGHPAGHKPRGHAQRRRHAGLARLSAACPSIRTAGTSPRQRRNRRLGSGPPSPPTRSAPGTGRGHRQRLPAVPTEAVTPATVTNIETGDDRISFDRVCSPVLVKVSDFSNWEGRGADGPYRVTSNRWWWSRPSAT